MKNVKKRGKGEKKGAFGYTFTKTSLLINYFGVGGMDIPKMGRKCLIWA